MQSGLSRAGGSGSAYIYGFCDKNWRAGMSEADCHAFVVKAVSHAMARDGSSGGAHCLPICCAGLGSRAWRQEVGHPCNLCVQSRAACSVSVLHELACGLADRNHTLSHRFWPWTALPEFTCMMCNCTFLLL